MVEQSSGEWATNHPVLAWPRHDQALLHSFDRWELTAVGREHKRIADTFAFAAIDQDSQEVVHLYGHNPRDAQRSAHRVRCQFQQHGQPAAVRISY